jgi:hypothetical protein
MGQVRMDLLSIRARIGDDGGKLAEGVREGGIAYK